MQLVIAEKPSVGVALAKALGVTEKKDGYVLGTDHKPVSFDLENVDESKYQSVMYEKGTLRLDKSAKETNIDDIKEQMKYSDFTLAAEISRYLNVSCILIARILRESIDGIQMILDYVNRYNEILNDIIVPTIFKTLYEVMYLMATAGLMVK